MRWLRGGTLFPETEGFMLAIQDQIILIRNYQKFIHKFNINDKCRICNRESETIQHIISGCKLLANTEYLHRHNFSANIIHQQLTNKYNLINETVPYYEYQPKKVLENSEAKLYWDRKIIIEKTINYNRPCV